MADRPGVYYLGQQSPAGLQVREFLTEAGRSLDTARRELVDEAVLERSGRVGCIDATFRWDDVGSWESFARNRPTDEHANVCEGEVHLAGATGNVALATAGRLALFGVDDLLVVQTGEVTLVMPRSESPHLKRYLAELPQHLLRPGSGHGTGADDG